MLHWYRILRFGLLTGFLLAGFQVQAAELSFGEAPGSVRSFELSELQQRLRSHRIQYFDPHYGKEKRFLGFALQDLLDLGFGAAWRDQADSDVIFEALDGYRSVGDRAHLDQAGGYVVFDDLDREDWEPIGKRGADPGPFYLAWTRPEQSTAAGFPWPWQLHKIHLVSYCERFPNVCPAKDQEDDGVVRTGFALFKARCVRCHAISGQGGNVGPDLNAPMNVTEYRSEFMLKAFIRQPSRFRYSRMPDHTDLSDADLDALLGYLRNAKQRGLEYTPSQ